MKLAGVSLGGGHALFAAGAHSDDEFGDPRHGAIALVRDADRDRAALRASSRTALVSVDSPDCEIPTTSMSAQIERALVKRQHARRGQRHRHARGDFDQVAAELRGVIRGAARHQHHQAGRPGFEFAPQIAQAWPTRLAGFWRALPAAAASLQAFGT